MSNKIHNKNIESSCLKTIDIPVRKVHNISYDEIKPKICKKDWYPIFVNGEEVLAYKETCK